MKASIVMTMPQPPVPALAQGRSSRRRRLWEIPRKFHCPLIGVCFDCDELRRLMSKTLHLPRATTDFVVHTTAVGNCGERGTLCELLHKTLERRYPLTVRRFAAIKTSAALAAAWQDAVRDGQHIPAALWAVWTHPACDEQLEQEVYADIHMIQHQVGASTRIDARTLQNLRDEKAALQEELQQLRQEMESLRQQRATELAAQNAQLNALRVKLSARLAWGKELEQALQETRAAVPDLASRTELLVQRDQLRQSNQQLKAALELRESEIERLQELLRCAEQAFASVAQEEAAQSDPACANLGGKCVLCVGGRAGAISTYRALVEQCGGRFMHHDGGIEQSLHRIDSVLAGADIVICQTGCISHSAYWRVKDLCRRSGKPCMFVKTASASSFERVINEVGRLQSGTSFDPAATE